MEQVRKKTVRMSEIEALDLISNVKEQRCLWEKSHKDHRKQAVRDQAWEIISINMGRDADELVEKWKSLQASYRSFKSRYKHAREEIKWIYYHAMQFLDGINEDEKPITPTTPVEFMDSGRVSENIQQVRKPKLVLRKKLVPHDIKRRLLMRRAFPGRLNQPVRHYTDAIQVEHVSISPPPIPPDILLAEDPVEPVAQSTSPLAGGKILHNAQPLNIPAAVVGKQDEDFNYAQSVTYLLKQFPPRTKRKLQIEIHDLIVTAQKKEYEKQFGKSYK
uniref:MADF domain-containing protein n=1 Tax=Anopheles epiroticus TaxID=199890 RepID=A0A182P1W3_9DIPT